jgi:DNA polymerase-1
MFGRRRPLKDIDNRNVAVRNNTERMAMNAPVQGTAADIMKLAMLRAHAHAKKHGARLVLQVHDELVLDAPADRADEALAALKNDMEHAVKLAVPLDVNGGVGKSWIEI